MSRGDKYLLMLALAFPITLLLASLTTSAGKALNMDISQYPLTEVQAAEVEALPERMYVIKLQDWGAVKAVCPVWLSNHGVTFVLAWIRSPGAARSSQTWLTTAT